MAVGLGRAIEREARNRELSAVLPLGVFGTSRWKRVLDVVLSGCALLLVTPLMAAVAVLVKLTSPGPVVFKQERIGINQRTRDRRRSLTPYDGPERRQRDRRVQANYGKPFTIYKFRTMVADAEKGTPMWSKKKDARITPVGKVLRMTRIDELPQFLNVLRGDMSVVGPRPERAYFINEVERDIPSFNLRLRTKPGITGLAQVKVGYTNTVNGLADKLFFDLEYIKKLGYSQRHGMLTDLKILLQTVTVVVTGKGAC